MTNLRLKADGNGGQEIIVPATIKFVFTVLAGLLTAGIIANIMLYAKVEVINYKVDAIDRKVEKHLERQN